MASRAQRPIGVEPRLRRRQLLLLLLLLLLALQMQLLHAALTVVGANGRSVGAASAFSSSGGTPTVLLFSEAPGEEDDHNGYTSTPSSSANAQSASVPAIPSTPSTLVMGVGTNVPLDGLSVFIGSLAASTECSCKARLRGINATAIHIEVELSVAAPALMLALDSWTYQGIRRVLTTAEATVRDQCGQKAAASLKHAAQELLLKAAQPTPNSQQTVLSETDMDVAIRSFLTPSRLGAHHRLSWRVYDYHVMERVLPPHAFGHDYVAAEELAEGDDDVEAAMAGTRTTSPADRLSPHQDAAAPPAGPDTRKRRCSYTVHVRRYWHYQKMLEAWMRDDPQQEHDMLGFALLGASGDMSHRFGLGPAPESATLADDSSRSGADISARRQRSQANMQSLRGVLLADLRDVVFQSDPFANLWKVKAQQHGRQEEEGGGVGGRTTSLPILVVAQEAAKLRVRDCPFNLAWANACYGHGVVGQRSQSPDTESYGFGESPIFCSGTTLGEAEAVRVYLSSLLDALSGCTHLEHWEQSVHSMLIAAAALAPSSSSSSPSSSTGSLLTSRGYPRHMVVAEHSSPVTSRGQASNGNVTTARAKRLGQTWFASATLHASTTIVAAPAEGDWVCTLGNMVKTGQPVYRSQTTGDVVSGGSGVPCALVHQYDRFPELTTHYMSKFASGPAEDTGIAN